MSWQQKARYVKRYRESGFEHGLVKMANEPDGWPLRGDLLIDVCFTARRRVDLDNLFVGLKPWIDGLEDVAILANDRQIVEARVRVQIGKRDQTHLTLRELGKGQMDLAL